MTKEAAFQRTAEMHAAAKAEIINQVYDAVAAEQAYTAQVQKKLNTERKLARVLVLDLINVCNDNLPEADQERCNPYEDQLGSFTTLERLRTTVSD
jgi:hypothetical protein